MARYETDKMSNRNHHVTRSIKQIQSKKDFTTRAYKPLSCVEEFAVYHRKPRVENRILLDTPRDANVNVNGLPPEAAYQALVFE